MKKVILICVFILMITAVASAQGNGFNFQGRLNDGTNPANGRYDLQFRLYDAIAGGNQIGAAISSPNTVLINGVFSVTLDFGATAFNSPNSVFIEISIRPNGSPNAFTILGPRQQLTVVPFAVRAATATNADNATLAQNAVAANTAVNAANATNAATATNSLNLGGVPPTGWAQLNVINTGDLKTNGVLSITGNAFQPITANGFVKAMMVYEGATGPANCYNGIANLTTGGCGFVVTTPLGINAGVTRINFGFPVTGRFISVTGQYIDSVNQTNNGGANYRVFDATTVEVFTFASGDSADTSRRGFTIIMF